MENNDDVIWGWIVRDWKPQIIDEVSTLRGKKPRRAYSTTRLLDAIRASDNTRFPSIKWSVVPSRKFTLRRFYGLFLFDDWQSQQITKPLFCLSVNISRRSFVMKQFITGSVSLHTWRGPKMGMRRLNWCQWKLRVIFIAITFSENNGAKESSFCFSMKRKWVISGNNLVWKIAWEFGSRFHWMQSLKPWKLVLETKIIQVFYDRTSIFIYTQSRKQTHESKSNSKLEVAQFLTIHIGKRCTCVFHAWSMCFLWKVHVHGRNVFSLRIASFVHGIQNLKKNWFSSKTLFRTIEDTNKMKQAGNGPSRRHI